MLIYTENGKQHKERLKTEVEPYHTVLDWLLLYIIMNKVRHQKKKKKNTLELAFQIARDDWFCL